MTLKRMQFILINDTAEPQSIHIFALHLAPPLSTVVIIFMRGHEEHPHNKNTSVSDPLPVMNQQLQWGWKPKCSFIANVSSVNLNVQLNTH